MPTTIEPFRKRYNARIDELETAVRDAHAKIGDYLAYYRRIGWMPDKSVMLAYDNLLLASNTMNAIKAFAPSMTFSDEKEA